MKTGSHSMTKGGHPNILPQDLSTVPNHYSVGHYGSVPLMPLQSPFNQIPPPYMPPLIIPQWPSIIVAQLPPSDPGRLHGSRSNHEQIIHTQQQSSPAGKRISRKLLTDELRRQICIYHESQKPAKQKNTASKHNLPMRVYKSAIVN